MGALDRIPAPPAAVSRVLARFDRPALEGFIAVALDLLDLADGDPETEDATDVEDDFGLSPMALQYAEPGPGCAVADHDAGAYIEWDTKPTNKRKAHAETLEGEEDDETVGAEDDFHPNGGSFTLGRGWPAGPGCPISDPDVGIDDNGHDDLNDDREEEHGDHPAYGIDQTKGPLPPSMIPDRVAMRKHLNRIRETRCDKITYRGSYTQRTHVEFRLKD